MIDLKYALDIPGLIQGEVGCGDGALIDLSKLPEDIAFLRICMN